MTRLDTIERLRAVLIEARYLIDKLSEQDNPGDAAVKERPPTQVLAVHGIDSAVFGQGESGPDMTIDMAAITKAVYLPRIRLKLSEMGGFALPDEVQHARRKCEQFILQSCGALTFRELAVGKPADRLRALLPMLGAAA